MMHEISRRAALGVLLASPLTAHAASEVVDGVLWYRGFVVDMKAVEKAANIDAIVAALKKQLDIVADCGVKPEILAFFIKQRIQVKQQNGTDHSNGNGSYSRSTGVTIDPAPTPTERPILLHELLHALHTEYVPDGVKNADIARYYGIAVERSLYPKEEYLMRNEGEFFAITGSVYLSGYVARTPNNRETLKQKQPVYYQWLGDLFGVKK